MSQAAWDEVWQRFYDRSLVLGLTPNKAVTRATEETISRHGPRPERGEAS